MVRAVEDEGHLVVESSIDDEAHTARVKLEGELDLNGVDAVTHEFDGLGERDVDTVLADASGLTFLDSSGLRALLTGRETLRAKGVQLRVVDPSPAIARLLDMTGTRSMLEG
jgi:anti-anti-sigma factor